MFIFFIAFLVLIVQYELVHGPISTGLMIVTMLISIATIADAIVSLIFIIMEIYKWYFEDKKFKYLFKLIKHFKFRPMNIYNKTDMNMISCIFLSAICMLVLDLYSFGIYLVDFVYFVSHIGRVKFD